MFSTTTNDHIVASELAGHQLRAWEKALALRVSLQKPMDLASRLPVNLDMIHTDGSDEMQENIKILNKQLRVQLRTVSDLLSSEAERSTKLTDPTSAKKRKGDALTAADKEQDLDQMWEQIYKPQQQLQTERWEPILNKWHARLNFGSEKTKAKMKVFTHTMWNQVQYSERGMSSVVEYTRALTRLFYTSMDMPNHKLHAL